jgi:tryptophanyl-tRNA synthetase
MDLQDPTRKMSKSSDSDQGTILVLDDADVLRKKIKRAVTDTDGEVRYDVRAKPGVSNLIDILAACSGRSIEDVAAGYSQYGPLKNDTAEAVIELLSPVRRRFDELSADPGEVANLLRKGADKARTVAVPTLERAYRALGLLAH